MGILATNDKPTDVRESPDGSTNILFISRPAPLLTMIKDLEMILQYDLGSWTWILDPKLKTLDNIHWILNLEPQSLGLEPFHLLLDVFTYLALTLLTG